MNRRSFLTRLSTGLVGACVAAHIPTGILPAKVRSIAALDYLTEAYNRVCRGSSAAFVPRTIWVGRELYEAAKHEIDVRGKSQRYFFDGPYVDPQYDESLKFKASTLIPTDYLSQWQIVFQFRSPDGFVVVSDYYIVEGQPRA